MGRHRAHDPSGRRSRGVARWPIVAAALVALLLLGWAGWNWGVDASNDSARNQVKDCPEGTTTLRVLVSPDIATPLTAAARSWNEARTAVHGHCVHTRVDAVPSSDVRDALLGDQPLTSIGGLPEAWIPDAERWLVELRNTKPGRIAASAESIASSGSAGYPYVGLQHADISPVQERAAQTFRAYVLRGPQRPAFERAGFGPPHGES